MPTLPDVLRGTSAIATDATVGLIDVVEAMHATIGRRPSPLGSARERTTRGLTGTVYRTLRGATRAVGNGAAVGLGALGTLLPDHEPGAGLEAFVGVLNGISGDYLAERANPLAVEMRLRRAGRPVDAAALARTDVTRKALVLVHGLCLTDRQWSRDGHDHGELLARQHGYTALYLHYNSGLHISANGRELAALLEEVVDRWPVPLDEVAVIGHSMGGLVARSACHYGRLAGHGWLRRLRSMVFLGTPHHGAPLERGGNRLDLLLDLSPYSAPLTRLGRARSAGITDLRYGCLCDEDWRGHDQSRPGTDRRRPVPLPNGVRCYAVAAVLGERRGSLRDRLVGDGLVPIDSALGRHARPELTLALPASHQWVASGTGHLELLSSPAVYARMSAWLHAQPERRRP
jgi:pimeloyl-ACP methyl ester carboxylesterase